MKLLNILMVIPFIFLLVACPPAVTDDDDSGDDDSAGDDDSSVGDDDDDSAEGIIFMDEVRIFIENVCDNDLDDDHDGIVDCADPDCELAPDCLGL